MEVFGGGGAILLAKEPEQFEVYNDLNSDLFNLFRCIRDKPLSFIRAAGYFPLTSRQEFYMLLDFLQKKPMDQSLLDHEQAVAKDIFDADEANQICAVLQERAELYDVDRAVAFYKVMHTSYGGMGRSFGSQPMDLGHALLNIYKVAERLKNVIIENKDFEGVIKQYDGPGTTFYVDPPYYQAEDYYQVDYRLEDHIRLAEILHSLQGKFLLSYNDCSFVRDLYQNDCMVSFSRPHVLSQRHNPGNRYEELLIANYDLEEQKKAPRQLTIFEAENL